MGPLVVLEAPTVSPPPLSACSPGPQTKAWPSKATKSCKTLLVRKGPGRQPGQRLGPLVGSARTHLLPASLSSERPESFEEPLGSMAQISASSRQGRLDSPHSLPGFQDLSALVKGEVIRHVQGLQENQRHALRLLLGCGLAPVSGQKTIVRHVFLA